MSNDPNQTRTWLFCLQRVFDLILLCPMQSLFSARTPTRRERGSGSCHFKPSTALGPYLGIAKLLRLLSPPCSALNYLGSHTAHVPCGHAAVMRAAKAADLWSRVVLLLHCFFVVGIVTCLCWLPVGPCFRISWGSIPTENRDGEGRVPLGQWESGDLLVGGFLEAA